MLLAYAKLQLFDEINSSALPDDPFYVATLKAYFPREVGERFPEGPGGAPPEARDHRDGACQRHRQSRRTGVHAPAEGSERQRSAGAGARLHDRAAARSRSTSLPTRINALDNKIPARACRSGCMRSSSLHLTRQTLWFYAACAGERADRRDDRALCAGLEQAARHVLDAWCRRPKARRSRTTSPSCAAAGVPDDLADDIGALAARSARRPTSCGCRSRRKSRSTWWRAPISRRRARSASTGCGWRRSG